MKETVVSVVTGTLRTVHKILEKDLEELEIGGCAVTIQTTALLTSVRIQKIGLEA